MDEEPRQPVERREVVEHRETVQREGAAAPPEPARRRGSMAWLWVLLLVLLVGALAWYALSRGEPQQVDLPEVEAPEVDLPDDEPNIEVNVGEGGGGD